jgi:hypothetical protein
VSTAPELIGKMTVAFERILGAALPRIESHGLVVRAAEEQRKMEQWKKQI